jgi:hypothetical protein
MCFSPDRSRSPLLVNAGQPLATFFDIIKPTEDLHSDEELLNLWNSFGLEVIYCHQLFVLSDKWEVFCGQCVTNRPAPNVFNPTRLFNTHSGSVCCGVEPVHSSTQFRRFVRNASNYCAHCKHTTTWYVSRSNQIGNGFNWAALDSYKRHLERFCSGINIAPALEALYSCVVIEHGEKAPLCAIAPSVGSWGRGTAYTSYLASLI